MIARLKFLQRRKGRIFYIDFSALPPVNPDQFWKQFHETGIVWISGKEYAQHQLRGEPMAE